MKYDGLLMLSGGKDSCSLAIKLVEEELNILAFTSDNGFLSQIAINNIVKITDLLEMDLVSYRPKKSLYRAVIEKLKDEKSNIDTICGECSQLTMSLGYHVAKSHGIDTIYAGFTKYTAEAAGWIADKTKMLGDIKLVNPYYEDYDLKAIIKQLEDIGIVWDPVKTNCAHIQEIIKTTNKRFGTNHLVKEEELLYRAGQLTNEQHKYFGDFVKQ